MPYYRTVGEVPRKRHTQFRRPDGGLYAEELMGQEGFSSDSSLFYHRHAPTAIVAAEEFTPPAFTRVPNLPLKPRHLRTHKLDGAGADPVLGRRYLLANDDVRIAYVLADRPSPLYRNATGDECLYVESGTATVETSFGALDVATGDYVIVPTSVVHRIVPTGAGPVRLLTIEASGHIGPPKRYLSVRGQFLEHSPYSQRDIRTPEWREPRDDEGEFVVHVKVRDRITAYHYRHHPFGLVGWDGYLWPYVFNIGDFEPITGRVHQPPPVHQTFQARNFVVCSFVPRKFDYHPLAIPAPYNHSNINSDEVIYYVAGNFMSRRGVDTSSFTLHPAGIPHGPHPGTAEASIGKEATEELAVMVDTFHPLKVTKQAAALDDDRYPYSWLPPDDGGEHARELAPVTP